MPLYEFHCTQCDAEFEELCSSSNTNSVSCPKCKNTSVERLMSVFAVSSRSNATGTPSSNRSGCGSCRATSCRTCSVK